MPRKTKTPKDPNTLNPLEKKVKDITLENEMLEKALKAKKKHLDEMEKLNAQERLLTGEEPDPNEDPDNQSPFTPRSLGLGGGGVMRLQPRTPEQAEELLQKQEAFEALLGDFQDTQGKVEIYRLKDGNTWAKMGSYSAKEWGASLESVAKKFGGGTYKVRLRAPNGTLAGENICEFDEDAYPKPGAIGAVAPVVNDHSSDMFKMMMEMQTRLHQESQAQMNQFITTMASMMGSKASLLSSVQDLATFKELFSEKDKKTPNPLENMNTLLTVLQQGMTLGRDTAPAGEEGGGILTSLLKNIMSGENLSRVGNILKTVVTAPPPEAVAPAPAPQVRQIPQQPRPAQAPAQPRPVNPNPPQETTGMNLAVLAYKPIIMGYARANQSPEKTAELIVTRIASINEGWLLIVDDFLKMPTTKEDWVYKYAPELREFDAWVDAVMTEMGNYIRELVAEAQRADDDDATGGETAPESQPDPATP